MRSAYEETRPGVVIGSGGPWSAYLAGERPELDGAAVVLTDLHPHLEAFDRVEVRTRGRAVGHRTPVDATDVPDELVGPRTIVNGFHHFRPEQARAVLADAVEKGVPVGVFEIMDRRPATLLPLILVPLFVVLLTPFVRPFRWGRLFWTYLLPVLPLLILWDGVVSALRTYSPEELRALVADLEAYRWDIGSAAAGGPGPARITYLFGWPR